MEANTEFLSYAAFEVLKLKQNVTLGKLHRTRKQAELAECNWLSLMLAQCESKPLQHCFQSRRAKNLTFGGRVSALPAPLGHVVSVAC